MIIVVVLMGSVVYVYDYCCGTNGESSLCLRLLLWY